MIIIALLGSICGSALIADWQSIGHDPCREYSRFQDNVTIDSQLTKRDYLILDPLEHCIHLNFTNTGFSYESLRMLSEPGYKKLYKDISISCKYSKNKYVSHCVDFDSFKWNVSATNFSVLSSKITTETLCAEFSLITEQNYMSKMSHTSMKCTISGDYASLCIDALNIGFFTQSEIESFKSNVIMATKVILGQSAVTNSTDENEFEYYSEHLNDTLFDVVSDDYGSAELSQSDICLSHDRCQWNQFSSISNSICYGCPGICRNASHSPSFIQFSFGVILFVLSIPVSRVILMVLISDNLNKNEQVGILLLCMDVQWNCL